MNWLRLFSATSLLFVAAACTDSVDKQLAATIRNYNNAVIEAYRSGDARPLIKFAAEKESNKVQVLIDIKLSNKLILESELQQFKIEKISPEADGTYSVRTRERWKYYDRSLKVGVPPGQTFVADIYLDYKLRKENGSWKVQKVKAEKTDYIEKPK